MSKLSPDSNGTCPICHKPTETTYRPFCSKHCADIDLGRWFSGTYAIPAVETDADDEDSPGGTETGTEFPQG